MADWKDDFREGSFRGVPFKVESSQVKGGRRKQDREFAKRDTGNSEDLGKKLKSFNLDLLVIGDDYFQQRDALEVALDTEGPGELVHPYRGVINVQAGEFTLTESKDQGRVARFNVEFTLAGELKFPNEAQDALNESRDNADAVKENSKSAFETAFSVAQQPAFVLESATAKVNAVLDFADDAVKKVTEPVTNFAFAISDLKASLSDLIKKPGELADRLEAAFQILLDEFVDEPETSERIFGNFVTLEDDDAFDPVAGDTPSRVQEQKNQDAVFNLTKELTLADQSQAAIDVDFASNDDALLSRNAIVDGLDAQLILSTDDDLFQSIKDLQSTLVQALPQEGTSDLVTIILNQTLPVLVIAHDNFEDLDKEDEIIEQNSIEHPGFAPGGEVLQVSVS